MVGNMYPCNWYDPVAKDYCSFKSPRRWNLERHIEAHKLREVTEHKEFGHGFGIPDERAVFSTPNVYAMRHRFPKSSIHMVLIPILPQRPSHPFDFFEDPTRLSMIREEVQKLHKVVATQLRKLYGPCSAQDKERSDTLGANLERGLDHPDQSPGRDWSKEVMICIHASSAIDWPHIHVLSRDLVGTTMKDKSHYNSFQTPFFIRLDELPLTKDKIRRREQCLHEQLKCWRCGATFGNDMKALNEHLAEELEAWKME